MVSYTAAMRPVLLLVLTLLLPGCAGCAAQPPVDDPLGQTPEDLTIELTILHGRDVEAPRDIDRRPARFVVYPDGSLHHDQAVEERAVRPPGFIRRLNREQQSDLWLLLRQLGFADAERGEPSHNLRLILPQRDEVMHQLAVIADDRRRVFVQRTGADVEPDAAMRELVQRLAQLAWLPEEPPGEPVIIPPRYDFGPDPYARYR